MPPPISVRGVLLSLPFRRNTTGTALYSRLAGCMLSKAVPGATISSGHLFLPNGNFPEYKRV